MAKFKTAWLVPIILLASTNFAQEKGTEPVPDNAQTLAAKYREARQTVVEAEAEKRRILGSLYSINQRMKKIGVEKAHLTDELFQVQDDVRSIAKIIAGLETQIQKQRRQLKRRLRALYKLSGEGFLGVVFSQRSAPELDESLRYLKIVTDNDYKLIRSYQGNLAAHKVQSKKLRAQVERLVGIEKRIKKQELLLTDEHKAKSQVVSELDRHRSASLSRMQSLRSKSQSLKTTGTLASAGSGTGAGSGSGAGLAATGPSAGDEIDELLKPSIFEQKGQLPPPIIGKVIQDFGLITDDLYKIQLSHKGWLYQAAKGSPVASIFDGTVLFAERLAGYGASVIVDHGDHYYSVYAHISRMKVKTGDSVKRGQVIAEAGSGSRRHGEGIYFEIRHFSEPENPANWISNVPLPVAPVEQTQGRVPEFARAIDDRSTN
jgi:septal ring factor EnvC (AmiA/AmiB activator)